LRALRDKVEKAINAGDMKELRTCLAEDFTFITSDQTVLTNWTGIVTYWDGMFKNEKSPVTAMTSKFTADILTKFTGPNTGYCRGTSRDVYTLRNKRKVALQNTWSVMVIKEQGAWRISAAHVGVNFLDNPVLKAKEMSWFGKLCVGLKLRKLPGEVKE
jgi:ketosteroid isomerase-like protein